MADNQIPRGRALGRAVRRFLELESASGIVLLGAAVVALIWANSPWRDGYHALWEPLHTVVNDGLMAVFFFVVGLEIKREVVSGELQDPKAVGLPVLAAAGGMVVPAAIYAALNAGGPGSGGWGIPMATDIAFAVGVLALFGDRIPPALKVFLLTLAIADDVGAIVVIAVFYSAGLSWPWLVTAAAGLVLVAALGRLRVPYVPVLVTVGVAVWFATYRSGVHATIAGVALG
ncbi:MAG: Na+/H+ antiporter NhaA, partial [Acidimicrobiales bacterium]